jgi:hypothetical protein
MFSGFVGVIRYHECLKIHLIPNSDLPVMYPFILILTVLGIILYLRIVADESVKKLILRKYSTVSKEGEHPKMNTHLNLE